MCLASMAVHRKRRRSRDARKILQKKTGTFAVNEDLIEKSGMTVRHFPVNR